MDVKLIDSAANAILNKLSEVTLPIKIEDLARMQGLKIMPYPLEDDVSGLLVIEENGQGIIGYNQNEPRVRRRFTIAHELGHYELHKDKSHLFVDKEFKQFRVFRSQGSAADLEKVDYEREANAFAATLLMPEKLIKQELAKTKIDLGSEKGLKELAKTFDVSTTAMYFRLNNLQLL